MNRELLRAFKSSRLLVLVLLPLRTKAAQLKRPQTALLLTSAPKRHFSKTAQQTFWVSSKCRNNDNSRFPASSKSVRFSSSSHQDRNLQAPKSKKRVFKTRIAPAALAALVLYFALNDDFRQNTIHFYKMMKRSGIVGVATVRCLVNYKMVLSKTYASEEERLEALSKCHDHCAHIVYKALSRNGGIYIKLGQHLSALTYLLPKEWPEAMIPLQDQCPRSSVEEISQLFKDDLGEPVENVFEEFDENPIGVASLAQVHIATLKGTNNKVAVKCQHPSLQEFVPLDLLLTQTVFKALTKIFPEYDLNWLGDELQRGIYIELDFNIEAENSRSTAEYFKKFKRLTALKIPKITWSSDRILIMDYLPGVRLDDLDYLDKHHISRSQVSSCLAHIFNNMIFTPGVGIHCDPHGGNLAIRAVPKSELKNGHNFEIILYDHGQYRHVSTPMRRAYSKMWLAILDSRPDDVKKYAKQFAGVSDELFPLFAAAITGRDFNHAVNDVKSERTGDEIEFMSKQFREGNLLSQLMELLASLPRIVLLILKTNDLVRNLDERLQNPLGLEKGFMIMASYCAQTVYYEDIENISNQHTVLSLLWIVGYLRAWWKYEQRVAQLRFYDIAVTLQQLREKFNVKHAKHAKH